MAATPLGRHFPIPELFPGRVNLHEHPSAPRDTDHGEVRPCGRILRRGDVRLTQTPTTSSR